MPILKNQNLLYSLRHGDPVQCGQLPLPEQRIHPRVSAAVLPITGELLQLGVQLSLLALIVLLIAEKVLPADKPLPVILVG
ncbi:hypothetical protein EI53_02038 [Fusobacterium naviforme]|nr:hypothetical protein EI53_02038 [Fusobacterium naviforme]STO28348.1 Uncharacterised protein [Fusobacterium naviforme]